MEPSSDISILRIQGKEFVSGLMWRPLSKPRGYMKEAREIGKEEGMDIVSIRLGLTMIQAGFVKKESGATKGMYSLAAALAGQIKEESWIGAFQVSEDLFALVAVHGGLIVPGCDTVGTKEEIRNLLVEKDSHRVMKFEKVYHPDDFNHRGQQIDIDELLSPSRIKKEYALKQLTFGMTRKELIITGCLFGALVAGGLGYLQWVQYQERLAREEAARQELAREQARAELEAQTGGPVQAQALEHPWAKMPGSSDFLNGCMGAINSLPLAMGGWTFDSAICTATTLETVFGRAGGSTFDQFVLATQSRFPAPPVLLEGGDRAGLGEEITLGMGGDDELLSVDEVRSRFTSHLQRLELKAEISEVQVAAPTDPQALPGQENGAVAPAPDWKQFSFTLTTPHAPEIVFSEFHLNGLRLTEIATTRSGSMLSWTVKGDIYAR
ncbi:type 4b pilus protein PilO2 [Metapseudomonas furukawaii]|uniref:Uncharacterized protein n=1 Tax=Metapseudomonas furukawaii TaxID=1149133 RepID=L8MH71_METFU|nr:type 4b pilus protein PilO2 [Pseudomonas furukawaii]ELS25348.1 hypothetical protein ppKF707_2251 [Pseudomonas furukawaii]ELS27560.1 PilO, putative [Pseudomonas furukawaii]BAU77393.1 hypothetical protein KF707C_p40 [Pseudomonas furukawaii]